MAASINDSKTGRKIVKPTMTRLTDNAALRTTNGVTVYSDLANNDVVWLGFSNIFTIDFKDDSDGFPLFPGSSILLPTRTPYEIYLRAGGPDNLKVWWVVS